MKIWRKQKVQWGFVDGFTGHRLVSSVKNRFYWRGGAVVLMRYVVEFWSDHRPLTLLILFFSFCNISLFATNATQVLQTVLCWFLGVAFFYWAEYLIHRFLLHGGWHQVLKKAYEGHEQHHQKPNDMAFLLTPNRYSLPVYIVLWIVIDLFSHQMVWDASFLSGVSLAQIYYEWVHFIAHRPIVPYTKFGRLMKKHHLLHHFKSNQFCFGVTNAALDRMFGTTPKD